MPSVIKAPNSDNTYRVVIDQLDQGWSNRSFPHLISERQLYVADNVVFNRNGLVSKRPGNVKYGGGNGQVGTAVASLSGTRFYPVAAGQQLIVQSNGQLYKGNDGTGAFTAVGDGNLSKTQAATYVQVYDPDMSSGANTALVVCDGSRVPRLYDGTHFVAVQTGTPFGGTAPNALPTGRTGQPITPLYCLNWQYHLVYSGEPTEPTAIYIADALRPERFNGYGLTDSAGTSYTPYFPAGRDGTLGAVTGLGNVGPYLIIYYTAGIVVGINTGTYGAEQYQFFVLSRSTGNVAPRSLVSFEGFEVFFGGDRFYATDAQTIVPLPDEIPSVYANNAQSGFASEMKTKNSVVGVRRGGQYWAAYDNVGAGKCTSVAVFDLLAGGGWSFGAPTGGAWSRWPSGMPISWGLECRGPGDSSFPMFWGSSQADLIAQNDAGTFGDFGAAILVEIRAKAYFLDRPIWPKDVQGLYILGAFPVPFGPANTGYTDTVTAYVITDFQTSTAPAVQLTATPNGPQYGGAGVQYGTVQYGQSNQILTSVQKSYPQQDAKGYIVQPGCIEFSTNPFNVLGFVVDLIIDEPNP